MALQLKGRGAAAVPTPPADNVTLFKETGTAAPALKNADGSVDTLSTVAGQAAAVAVVQADVDAHQADTANPHAVTKAQVGLSAADNTSDVNKPVSTAQATAIAIVQADIDGHQADVANPHAVTKAQVGLSAADNTSDADKPVSTAQLAALNLKAPLASPALTGVPTAPTAAAGTNTTQLATTAHVLAERTNAATLTNKTLTAPVLNGTVTGTSQATANTPSTLVMRDASGNFAAGTITGDLTGNISGTAPAGTLTGTTLAAGVVTSSISQLGTNVGIGSAAAPATAQLFMSNSATGAVSISGVRKSTTINSDVTSLYRGFLTVLSTQAAAFTLADVFHYTNAVGTLGAGSAVTRESVFHAADTNLGTTTYAFRGLIASGATRWNCYMAGTAQNAFQGNVRIGSVVAPTVALDVTGAIAASGGASVAGGSLSTTAAVVNIAHLATGKLLSGAANRVGSIHTYADDSAIEVVAGTTSGYKTGITLAGRSYTGNDPDSATVWARDIAVGKFTSTGFAVTGLLDLSAATAGQIKFPATRNASADANTLDDYQEASYTGTATGLTTSPTAAVTYTLSGNTATINLPALTGTSNATTFTVTGMPAEARPATRKTILGRAQDNGGAHVAVRIDVETTGVLTIYSNADAGAFTASGTKSLGECSASYTLV